MFPKFPAESPVHSLQWFLSSVNNKQFLKVLAPYIQYANILRKYSCFFVCIYSQSWMTFIPSYPHFLIKRACIICIILMTYVIKGNGQNESTTRVDLYQKPEKQRKSTVHCHQLGTNGAQFRAKHTLDLTRVNLRRVSLSSTLILFYQIEIPSVFQLCSQLDSQVDFFPKEANVPMPPSHLVELVFLALFFDRTLPKLVTFLFVLECTDFFEGSWEIQAFAAIYAERCYRLSF